MNYLAHSLLSCNDNDLLFGNLLADIINNDQVSRLTEGQQRGVELHRLIDSYTDNHPLVRECTRVLQVSHGKYSPVVFDLLCDMILTKFWDDYSEVSISDHVAMVDHVMRQDLYQIDDRPKHKMTKMLDNHFLTNCTTERSFIKTMEWMDKRTKFPSEFTTALDDYRSNEELFDRNFKSFFNDLRKEAMVFCGC